MVIARRLCPNGQPGWRSVGPASEDALAAIPITHACAPCARQQKVRVVAARPALPLSPMATVFRKRTAIKAPQSAACSECTRCCRCGEAVVLTIWNDLRNSSGDCHNWFVTRESLAMKCCFGIVVSADFLVDGARDGVCCNRMRRILAAMLVLLFGYTPIAPAFAANSDSLLPACCRRTGQHHCSMMSAYGDPDQGQPHIQSAPSRCPLFPHSAIVCHSSFLLGVSRVHGNITHYPAFPANTESPHRSSISRGHQKRGPPAFSA